MIRDIGATARAVTFVSVVDTLVVDNQSLMVFGALVVLPSRCGGEGLD
jgi:hypothetical protein